MRIFPRTWSVPGGVSVSVLTPRGKVIAEISGPKASEAEAEIIREQLRGSVVQYELPADPAHAREEWAADQ